jgi:PEP-CTERM motif
VRGNPRGEHIIAGHTGADTSAGSEDEFKGAKIAHFTKPVSLICGVPFFANEEVRMIDRTNFVSLVTFLILVAPPVSADSINYSQNPFPFVSVENTKGNVGFITLTNTSPLVSAQVTSITIQNQFVPTAGEADDEAFDLSILAPNPVLIPFLIAPNGTANIKVSWDTVDTVIDNDVDSGTWLATLNVQYNYGGAALTTFPSVVVKVIDTPEPSSIVLLGTGLAGGLATAWRYGFRRSPFPPANVAARLP